MQATKSSKKYKILQYLLLAFALVFIPALPVASEDIKGQIRWNLADLYENDTAWQQAKEGVSADIDMIAPFKGTLSENPATLVKVLEAISLANKKAARVFIYASLKVNEDTRDKAAQENLSQAIEIFNKLEAVTAFVPIEIRDMGKDTIESWIEQTPALSQHSFRLNDIFLDVQSQLNASVKTTIADHNKNIQNALQSYRQTIGKSILWPWIMLETGQGITVDPTTYSQYRGVTNRQDRIKVFDAFWQAWQPYEASFGRILNTVVSNHVASAKLQGFDDALSQALSASRIPTAAYHSLIKAANKHLPSLHRYLKLRQRMLGIKQPQYYDIYTASSYLEQRFTVDESKELALQALAPYGDQYLTYLKQGFSAEWMHVYPQPGKQSGAYTQNAGYDVHPYILLNYKRGFKDVSTFTHEWGHAVHALFSKGNNPFETYSYSPFIGELAAASNEVLLQEFMLMQDMTDAEYLYYIDQALEGIRASFFRQTMFAEFELSIHELSQSGQTLTGERLSELYLEILRKYHGHDQGVMTISPAYALEWAYIPHFFSNFYVYQNATSIVGGTMFATRILAGNTQVRDQYINMMKAGGSDYPNTILMNAGIDLTSDAPYNAMINRMEHLMNAAEVILDRLGR